MALRLAIALTVLVLASGCSATPTVTEPPAPTATTAAATPTTAAATSLPPATPTQTEATASPVAVDPCAAALTLADVGPGFTGEPPAAFGGAGLIGFVAGTQVVFQQASGSIGSTVACFDSAANAAATYATWGSSCIDANLDSIPAQSIQIGAIGGDASKGVFCPGDESGSTTISSSTSVYVLLDDVVFSVSVNREEPTGPDGAAVATAISLATALLEAIIG